MRGWLGFAFGSGLAALAGCGDSGAGGSDEGGGGQMAREFPRETGLISVFSQSFMSNGSSVNRWNMAVGYGELIEDSVPRCFPEEIGHCLVLDCHEGASISPGYRSISVGEVKLTGGAEVVTIMPDGALYTQVGSATETLYAAGDAITVTVAGNGDIPQHSLTVTAPSDVSIVAPELATPSVSSPIVTIDRSQDLVVEWVNGSTGQVGVSLGSHDAFGERRTGVYCVADASAGAMTIPSSVLATLLPTGIETTSGINITVFDTATTTAGDCEVTFEVQATATDSGGRLVLGNAGFY